MTLSRLSIVSLLVLTIACSKSGQDSEYHFRKGFEGNVMIIFEDPNGTIPLSRNGVRIYQIDSTGLLRTKIAQSLGIKTVQFFYVDMNGNKIAIPYRPIINNKNEGRVIVVNQETGTIYDTVKKKLLHFELFTVGKVKRIDSLSNLKDSFFWQHITE